MRKIKIPMILAIALAGSIIGNIYQYQQIEIMNETVSSLEAQVQILTTENDSLQKQLTEQIETMQGLEKQIKKVTEDNSFLKQETPTPEEQPETVDISPAAPPKPPVTETQSTAPQQSALEQPTGALTTKEKDLISRSPEGMTQEELSQRSLAIFKETFGFLPEDPKAGWTGEDISERSGGKGGKDPRFTAG